MNRKEHCYVIDSEIDDDARIINASIITERGYVKHNEDGAAVNAGFADDFLGMLNYMDGMGWDLVCQDSTGKYIFSRGG